MSGVPKMLYLCNCVRALKTSYHHIVHILPAIARAAIYPYIRDCYSQLVWLKMI